MDDTNRETSLPGAEAILDAHPDATLVVSGGVVVAANRASLRMLAAPRERVVGRALADLVAPGELARIGHFAAQRDAGWTLPEACQIRFVCDDRRVTADVRFDHFAMGGARATVLSARDVTDQDRAEKLIGELGALMSDPAVMDGPASLLEAATPIFRALGWSVAFTEVHDGFSITRQVAAPADHPVGIYGRSLLGLELPFAATPVLAEVVRTGRPLFLDNIPALLGGVTANAARFSEAMTQAKISRSAWCPVHRDGKLTHLLAVAAGDLTEHDFAAVQLFAALLGASIGLGELRSELVLRERLAAVGETAAILAHEVRSPLAVLVNALGLLKKRTNGETAELVGVMGEEIERLSRLVRDVLGFVGPTPATTPSAVPLAEVVDEAVAAAKLDPVFAIASPRIEVSVPSSIPDVLADRGLLRRALVNLLVNALEHVPAGGLVVVGVTTGADGYVAVRVTNDGAPIPTEVASRVFSPFFTTKATGTGLGLAVVKRIVDDLGGRVELEPSEKGVTFVVWLRPDRKGNSTESGEPDAGRADRSDPSSAPRRARASLVTRGSAA
jgi:signal transduction histidine kinase